MTVIPYQLLPHGARWFTSKARAVAHGGVLAEIRVTPTSTFFGVYKDQASLCSNAADYTAGSHPALIKAQIGALGMVHRTLPAKHCADIKLPPKGRWFMHETGALTAYSLQEKAFLVKVLLKTAKTTRPFYGVYESACEWDSVRNQIHRAYAVQESPFQTGTLGYDRCRCTLMRARGALHGPPRLNPLTRVDMLPVLGFVPHCDFWFATKEDALDMAGYTVEFTLPSSTRRYAVFRSCAEFAEALDAYNRMAGTSQNWTSYSMAVVSDPEGVTGSPQKPYTNC